MRYLLNSLEINPYQDLSSDFLDNFFDLNADTLINDQALAEIFGKYHVPWTLRLQTGKQIRLEEVQKWVYKEIVKKNKNKFDLEKQPDHDPEIDFVAINSNKKETPFENNEPSVRSNSGNKKIKRSKNNSSHSK